MRNHLDRPRKANSNSTLGGPPRICNYIPNHIDEYYRDETKCIGYEAELGALEDGE